MSAQMRPQPSPAPEPLDERRAPQLRVVSPVSRSASAQQRRARLMVIFAALVCCGVLFGLVGFHVVLAENQFKLEQMKGEAAAAQADYDRLRLEVAQLEAPERVVAVAQQRLGMVVPPVVTYLSPNDVHTTLVPQRGREVSGKEADNVGDREKQASDDGWLAVKRQLATRP